MKLQLNDFIRRAAILICGTALLACNNLDELEQRVDSLESRIQALETQLPALNDNVAAISALVEDGVLISSVKETGNGYVITTSDGSEYTLTNGAVGNTPQISVNEDGSITHGAYTVKGLGDRALTVYGANLSEESTIANNSDNVVTVDVNDNVTRLSSGGNITIPKADYIFSGNEEKS